MRASLLFLVSVFSAGVRSSATQQVIGSLGLATYTYQCQNGANPSVTCVDSSAPPNCSCRCSNGIIYNHTLAATSMPPSGTYPNLCQQEKDECIQREQNLEAQLSHAKDEHTKCNQDVVKLIQDKQDYANRVRDLNGQLAEYQKRSSTYMGCFEEYKDDKTFTDHTYDTWPSMTPQLCASVCEDYNYYGLSYGRYCHCGKSLKTTAKKVDGGECSVLCDGDKGQICGGHWRISLYSKS